MSTVSKNHRTFVSPPLRRVFLDAREDNSRAVIENLKTEIAALNRDKDLLTDRCDSAQSALTRLQVDERTVRLENRKVRADALEDKQSLNRLRAEYDAFKSRARNQHGLTLLFFSISIFVSVKLYSRSVGVGWGAVKRTSGQVSPDDDDSPCSSSD